MTFIVRFVSIFARHKVATKSSLCRNSAARESVKKPVARSESKIKMLKYGRLYFYRTGEKEKLRGSAPFIKNQYNFVPV